ncbi:uncharacterized protein XB5721655.S [Xenopus laevis]|uniref:Uncharacterized protein XB5721655.S n=2 Tax=Xenopus laevis TaxID=8355 RepID=A0A1L8EQE0_XENLA|nr:uncharacterized protein XB5721655.S [Xenopus laevis]OCT61557.1 hypothetical protein XELAEV_18047584mg [Xenopus laevis]
MKGALLAVLWSFICSAWAEVELPPGVDRRMYCESCLATVRELKKSLNTPTGETSGTKIKAQATKVCNALTFEKENFSSDKAQIACNHLLDTYGENFEDALLTEKEDTMEATICYIYTKACTGVKRETFKAQHFDDGAVEDLLQKHANRVRRSKPVVPEGIPGSQDRKEEL